MTGYVHALQSLGAVDGPGLRYVVFLQGCPLRCVYCHNPDTWQTVGGTPYSVEELTAKILRCKPYFQNGGGVTVSGGEPLLQAEFVAELFEKLHHNGIHTALDTAGAAGMTAAEAVLRHTDLVLMDLKFTNNEDYVRHTGGTLHMAEQFLALTTQMQVPLWLRHVVIPGINDTVEDLQKVQEMAAQYPNLEKIEWLPFHNLCAEKYHALHLPFPLEGTSSLSQTHLDALLQQL